MNVLPPIGAEARQFVDKLAHDLVHHQEKTLTNASLGDALHTAIWNLVSDHNDALMKDVSNLIDDLLTKENLSRALYEMLNAPPAPAAPLTPLPAADPAPAADVVKPGDPDAAA